MHRQQELKVAFLLFWFMEMLLLGDLEVPAFAAAIELHQKRITQAIFDHAMKICAEKNVRAPSIFFLMVLL